MDVICLRNNCACFLVNILWRIVVTNNYIKLHRFDGNEVGSPEIMDELVTSLTPIQSLGDLRHVVLVTEVVIHQLCVFLVQCTPAALVTLYNNTHERISGAYNCRKQLYI